MAFLIFRDEQTYLDISAIVPCLHSVENMPSSAGLLFSADPPFTSAEAMRVSSCPLLALLLGKFKPPSLVSGAGLLFLRVDAFFVTWNVDFLCGGDSACNSSKVCFMFSL